MKYSLKDLKAHREFQKMQLQHEYDKLQGYDAKLTYIYNLLLKTQGKLEEEYGGDFFKKNSLSDLLKKLKDSDIKDEVAFAMFINENVVKKTVSPHNRLKERQNEKQKEGLKKKQNEKPIKDEKTQNESKKDETAQKDDKNVTYDFDGKTLTVKICDFKSKHLEQGKEAFKEIEEQLKSHDCDSVIIDVRGNGGGTDEFYSLFSIFTPNDIADNVSYIDSLTGEEVETQGLAIVGDKNAKDYDRYLLVDGECFSATDALARICKKTGFATVVGEKTRGEGIGMTPFDLKIATLNEEQQKIYGATAVDMQFAPEIPAKNDSYMTTPDIVCAPSQAMETAKTLIESKRATLEPLTQEREM